MVRYWKLKDEALDPILWRIRCGRVYGPVVKQNVRWHIYIHTHTHTHTHMHICLCVCMCVCVCVNSLRIAGGDC